MIHHKIQNQVDVPTLTFCQQRVEILHCAVLRIDGVIVRNIILVIGGTGVDRHKPDTGDSQFLQIVQLGTDAIQVANAVAVRIAKRVNKNFVPGTVIIVGTFAQQLDLCNCLICLHRRPRILGGVRIGIWGCAAHQKYCAEQKTQKCLQFHRLIPSRSHS